MKNIIGKIVSFFNLFKIIFKKADDTPYVGLHNASFYVPMPTPEQVEWRIKEIARQRQSEAWILKFQEDFKYDFDQVAKTFSESKKNHAIAFAMFTFQHDLHEGLPKEEFEKVYEKFITIKK